MTYKVLFRLTIIYRTDRYHSKILDELIDLSHPCYEN